MYQEPLQPKTVSRLIGNSLATAWQRAKQRAGLLAIFIIAHRQLTGQTFHLRTHNQHFSWAESYMNSDIPLSQEVLKLAVSGDPQAERMEL